MEANIMSTKLKYKVYEISSSTTSASKSINELKTSVASVKKSANTTISKIGSLIKKWRSSGEAEVKGGCALEEELVLTVKSGCGVTEGVLGEKAVDNTIKDTT